MVSQLGIGEKNLITIIFLVDDNHFIAGVNVGILLSKLDVFRRLG